ncbi:MAG: phage holin family protein [Winogradskyella sp.]|uniref:phage holin family protein n=1 Tax=Winogradskyella sp. TaxID=1883156 RepID=UPI0025E5EC8F|nr:phage holin family protein [Winogradskyella sp.]NRB60765.1 phage holin family protein [Winogradskyella sp.]
MNLIIKLLVNAIAVFILAEFLSGVRVDGYVGAIIVAAVLSILNVLVKPVLVVLTLPVTIVTLGLFLFVVNALIILLVDKLLSSFSVDGIWTAIIFSVLLSFLQSILHSFIKTEKK